jgi:hypothetical protein
LSAAIIRLVASLLGKVSSVAGLSAESAPRVWTVSPRLNRTGYGDDDPTIIEPI